MWKPTVVDLTNKFKYSLMERYLECPDFRIINLELRLEYINRAASSCHVAAGREGGDPGWMVGLILAITAACSRSKIVRRLSKAATKYLRRETTGTPGVSVNFKICSSSILRRAEQIQY